MAEGMRDDLVGHDALVPSVGETQNAFGAPDSFV
jgi:hypothetical protein